MRRALFVVLLAACSRSAPPSVTLAPQKTAGPSAPVATSLVSSAPKSRLCGRAVADPYAKIAPDAAALLRATTAPSPYHVFPDPPPLPAEVVEGAAAELADPHVRTIMASLDPKNPKARLEDALAALRAAGAKWCVAAALAHPDIDVRIRAAKLLGKMGDRDPAAYLVEVAKSAAIFVSGSESATLHGIDQHAIADALNALTGEHAALRDGQDPNALTAGIPLWRAKICP